MEHASPNDVKYTQVLAAAATTIGSFSLGSALGWSSPSLPQLKASDSKIPITPNEGSWMSAALGIGAIVAAFVTGYVIDRYGRKTTMVCIALPFVLGWLLIAFAVNLAMIYIGRLLVGFSGGVFSLTAPVYIGETASPKIRGTLGSFYQLMLTLGVLFEYVLGTYVAWNWTSLVCAAIPILMAICVIAIPESPLYLIQAGKINEARKALLFLRPCGYDTEREISDIQAELEGLRANKGTLRDLAQPSNMKPFVIVMVVMAMQQLSGINDVLAYGVDIFSAASTTLSSNLQTILVGLLQVVFTVVAAALVDKAGRRLLLLTSMSGMALSIISLGVYFYLKDHSYDMSSLQWLPLTSMLIFVSTYSIGAGPIPWVILSELFQPHVKGIASSIATSFNWTLSFFTTLIFQTLVDGMGEGPTFWLFGAICAAAVLYTAFCIPETKGKSLSEIATYFSVSDRLIR